MCPSGQKVSWKQQLQGPSGAERRKGPAGQHPAAAGSSAPEPAGGGPETLGLLLLAATDAGSLVRSPALELPGQFSKGALRLAEISDRKERERECVCERVHMCMGAVFQRRPVAGRNFRKEKVCVWGGVGEHAHMCMGAGWRQSICFSKNKFPSQYEYKI